MNEINCFATEDDYVATARYLRERVDAGEIEELSAYLDEPFVYRRFLEKASHEVWVLAVPDQAFRGYLKREGTSGSLVNSR